MTRVHAYCSLPHYARHVRPILAALPPRVRGTMWGPRQGLGWGMEIPPELAKAGPEWMIVAGLPDAQRFDGSRPLVYVEHGAGQTYRGIEDHGSYSGGNHDGLGVRLYIAPSERVADRWRARGSVAAAVGCPRLDVHLQPDSPARRPRERTQVAFTWHWLCPIDGVPEAGTAWPWYELGLPPVLDALRAAGIQPVGHSHPRMAGRMRDWYQAWGVPYLDDLDTVLSTCQIVVADNTSAMFEAAAVGRRVVCLNAGYYRRDVDHGLRFWDTIPGPQVDHPAQLADMILAMVANPEMGEADRERAAGAVYAHRDGTSAARAAAAILEVLGE